MTAYAGNYAKSINETADLTINWATQLGSDTVAASVWAADAGITVVATTNTTTTTTIRVSGGTALTDYTLTNRVTTTAGQVYEQQILVQVAGLLTPLQLTRMQADLGITNTQTVFTDWELNDLYTEAGQDYDIAVAYGYRRLLAQASKLHTYKAGALSENLKEVRENLKDMLAYWEAKAGLSGARLSRGRMITGIDQSA